MGKYMSSSRLSIEALMAKNELTQHQFDDFIQRNVYLSAKKLINLYIISYGMSLKNDINVEIYAKFFVELELAFSQFSTEEISDALYELISDYNIQSKHKIELLLTVENETDPNLFLDLMNVIKMRIKVCQEKSNAFIVMPDKIFRTIIEAGMSISGISKLSFLHHHVHDSFLESLTDLSYQEHVGNYAKHMPDLNDIVLRSCSTVDPDFDNYKLKILKSSQDISAIQVQATTLLILQKEENDITTTYIKYKKNGLNESRTLTTIPLHKKNKFSAKELEEISSYCDVTLEQKYSPIKKDPVLVKKFFSDEPMTHEEVQLVKKMIIRARTENRKDFGKKPCMANTMMQTLMKTNYHGTLKGYIKGYKIKANRVVPVHGVDSIDAFPKAVKVKIDGNLSEEKSQPILEYVKNALMKFSDSKRYALFSPVEANQCTMVSQTRWDYPTKKVTFSQ